MRLWNPLEMCLALWFFLDGSPRHLADNFLSFMARALNSFNWLFVAPKLSRWNSFIGWKSLCPLRLRCHFCPKNWKGGCWMKNTRHGQADMSDYAEITRYIGQCPMGTPRVPDTVYKRWTTSFQPEAWQVLLKKVSNDEGNTLWKHCWWMEILTIHQQCR